MGCNAANPSLWCVYMYCNGQIVRLLVPEGEATSLQMRWL